MKNRNQLLWQKAIALASVATLATGTTNTHPLAALPTTQNSTASPLFDSRQNYQKIYTLSGHQYDVDFLAVSTDGQILVSHSSGSAPNLWSLKTRQRLRTLNKKLSAAGVLAITPNVQTLATAGGQAQANANRAIKVWNLTTHKLIRTLNGHSHAVTDLTISPDGQTLVSASDDKILVWNLKTGKRLVNINPQSSSIRSIAISPKQGLLVTGGGEYFDRDTSKDTTIKLWNIKTGKLLHTLVGHTSPISSIAISPNEQILVSVADSSVADSVKIWKLKTGQLLHTLTLPERVTTIAISFDGQKLATTSLDASVSLWNLHDGTLLKTLIEPYSGSNSQYFARIYPSSIAFSPDGKTLAIGYGGVLSSCGIDVWRVSS